MSINLLNEQLVRPSVAFDVLPERPAPATAWRWFRGVGKDGIKLEGLKIKGRLYTSREAVLRFVAAKNAMAREPPVAQDRDPATQRRLEEEGLV